MALPDKHDVSVLADGISAAQTGLAAGKAVAEASRSDPSIAANPLFVAGTAMSSKLESTGNGVARGLEASGNGIGKGLEAVGNGLGSFFERLFEGKKK